MTGQTEVRQTELGGLESVWESGMEDVYAFYRESAPPRVALAAALVESAVDLQRLGGPAPDPPQLLVGDLCLARASRLLAETGEQALQVGFAQAVERVAAAASAGSRDPGLRDLLLAAIEGAR
ncbi:MAG: hypothetical protein M3075_01935 [Candidatus Dormibacteraeota bacterium]|jgi:hypothetical protein|nr:hypothetical protein [Candidatus Dormibacteraeota bacterium]